MLCPINIENGFLISYPAYGNILNYTCDQGYNKREQDESTCVASGVDRDSGASGAWTNDPHCDPCRENK